MTKIKDFRNAKELRSFSMRKEVSLLIRVLLVITILLIPFDIFQELLQNITIKIVYKILEYSKMAPILGAYSIPHAIQILGGTTINIVKYCVTSSAYYLLAILTILTKGISITKKIKMFLIGSLLIFIMNIARIIFLIIIMIRSNQELFQLTHNTLSAALSIFYVILVWIFLSIIFKVKSIPIYTDIKDLIKK